MSAKSSKAAAKRAAADIDAEVDWAIRLGFFIHDASRLRRVIYDSALKPLGITRVQAWVLAFVSRGDGMAQMELADKLDLGKVALGGLIDRLEDSELVERHPDPNDRRVNRIFLTHGGRKAIKQLRKIAIPTNAAILAGISPREVRATAKTLLKIKANMLRMAND
jgi:MarR family transcriptional regulator, transcriptional regulator for hemolysin